MFGNIIAFLSLFISALVIFQEMNRRHEAERSLIHNEERFRLMVSGVKEATPSSCWTPREMSPAGMLARAYQGLHQRRNPWQTFFHLSRA